MSLPLLAGVALGAGYEPTVIHLGAEYLVDPGFDLSDYVRQNRIDVVAFSLHWHQQLFHTLCEARRVKEASPGTVVIVGGYTASLFARELRSRFPFIDYVVQGDGEVPFHQLLRHLKDKRKYPLSEVSNISDDSPPSYVLSSDDFLDSIKLCDLSRFRNPDVIKRLHWRHPWYLEAPAPSPVTWYGLPLGRGCSRGCGYCSGGAEGQKMASGRKGIHFFSPAFVGRFVSHVRNQGFEAFHSCFDPEPEKPGIWSPYFREMAGVTLFFESYGLPGEAFAEDFRKNLSGDSRVILSPESASERSRASLKSIHFTNKELVECLGMLNSLKVKTELYFTIGIPGENETDLRKTMELQGALRETCPSIAEIHNFIVELEPWSPWYLNPGQFGIHITRRGLDDFIIAHSRPEFSMGYHTDSFDYALINQWFCRYFCPIGKALCLEMSAEARKQSAPPWNSKYDISLLL